MELNDYLALVDHYYRGTNSHNSPETWPIEPADNYRLVAEKLHHIPQEWTNLYERVTAQPSVVWRRDLHYNHAHALKMMIGFSEYNGLIFYLSLLGNLSGVYFIDDKVVVNKRPIKAFDSDYIHYNLSYNPFTQEQSDFAAYLFAEASQCFPKFQPFDNKWADVKIRDIQLEFGFYKEVDLFQCLFGIIRDGLY